MDGRCKCKDTKWSNNTIGAKCPTCGSVIYEVNTVIN